MPFFDGATGRVYYRHWANPIAATPRAAVIFLHGFGEHTGLYHRLAHDLGAHGIDFWALDEIGHGLSDGDRGQFGTLADLVTNAQRLTAIVRERSPHTPLILAGHSLGTLVALLTALDAASDPTASAGEQVEYAGLVISGTPLSPLDWLLSPPADDEFELSLDDLSSDPFYRDQLETDPLSFTAANTGELLAQEFPPAWDRLERDLTRLSLPLLDIHGVNDQVAPLQGVTAWAERLPNLRIEVIDDAAHDVLNEHAHHRVGRIFADFVLDTVGATDPVVADA